MAAHLDADDSVFNPTLETFRRGASPRASAALLRPEKGSVATTLNLE